MEAETGQSSRPEDGQLKGQAPQTALALLCFFKLHEEPWLSPCKVTEIFPNFCRRICFAFWVPVRISSTVPSHPSVLGDSWGGPNRQRREASSAGLSDPLTGSDRPAGGALSARCLLPAVRLTDRLPSSLASGSFDLGDTAICLHGNTLS